MSWVRKPSSSWPGLFAPSTPLLWRGSQDVGGRNARGHHDSITSDPGLGRALMFGLRRKRVDQLRAGWADVAAIRALHGESPCPGPNTTTGVPTFTRAYRSIESSLVMRIQPDETALPMYSG